MDKPAKLPPYFRDEQGVFHFSPDPEEDARYKAIAWEEGKLRWKCRPSQQKYYDLLWGAMEAGMSLSWMFSLCRRFGKTSLLMIVYMEYCIRNPRAICRAFSSNKDFIKEIVDDVVAPLLADCPPNVKPAWDATECTFTFRNRSQVRLAGIDYNQGSKSRGKRSDLVWVDEAGIVKDLEKFDKAIIRPYALDSPHCRFIYTLTPPDTADHYVYKIRKKCMDQGTYFAATIEETDYPESAIRALLEEYAKDTTTGNPLDSNACLRECFSKWIPDTHKLVLPEWAVREDAVVRDSPRQTTPADPALNCWDFGGGGDGQDKTGVVLGRWLTGNNVLYIEDEILFSDGAAPSSTLVADARSKEEVLGWGLVPEELTFRWCDRNPQIVTDFGLDHDYQIVPVNKTSLNQMVRSLRDAFLRGHVAIHPRCANLREQLAACVWHNTRTRWEKQTGETGGHFDLVAALMYLWIMAKQSYLEPGAVADAALAADYEQQEAAQRHTDIMAERAAELISGGAW